MSEMSTETEKAEEKITVGAFTRRLRWRIKGAHPKEFIPMPVEEAEGICKYIEELEEKVNESCALE